MKIIARILKNDKGQALVEFALVLPLLLLLLFGIIEFGRVFGAELTVSNSAREGARVGAVGADDSVIIARAATAAGILDSSLLSVGITPEESARVRGGDIQVNVSYPVTIVAPFISAFTGDTVMVDSTCVMRIE